MTTPTVARLEPSFETRLLEDVSLVADGLRFPEGPVALSDGSVLVAEVVGGWVSRVMPDGRVVPFAETGGGPNGLAVGPDGSVYVANNGADPSAARRGRIERIDPVTGAVTDFCTTCEGRPLLAPNDLVFDAAGGLWFTDFGLRSRRSQELGSICHVAADGVTVTEVVAGVAFPNGIGIAADGVTLYWSETYTRRIIRRTITGPGELAPAPPLDPPAPAGADLSLATLLAGLPGNRLLDSLAVDATGAVCVGTLVDPGIAVVQADGASVVHLQLPPEYRDTFVTNICFGGDDLATAFVTLGGTGRLVRVPWPDGGTPQPFRDLASPP